MRIKNLKLMIIASILLLAGLISPGCMLMHFVGDHHEGMMGHGAKDHKDNKASGDQAGAEQQAYPLDNKVRTDNQGGVTVSIQFREITGKGEYAFMVKMDNRVIGIAQYALEKQSTLANDQGIEVRAIRWQGVELSAQHVAGTLYFPAKDDTGRAFLSQGIRKTTLRISGLAGIGERVFQWNIAPGHSGH